MDVNSQCHDVSFHIFINMEVDDTTQTLYTMYALQSPAGTLFDIDDVAAPDPLIDHHIHHPLNQEYSQPSDWAILRFGIDIDRSARRRVERFAMVMEPQCIT